jgi:hypothetical protein
VTQPTQPRSKLLTGKGLHTPIGMVGYCYKDKGKPHFECVMSALITPELLEKAQREYLLHGNVTSKGRKALTPKNLFETAFTFNASRLLGAETSVQGTVVRMLRSGLYFPSYAFIAGHGGSGLNLGRSNALWRLMRAGAHTRLDDVADVFFGGRQLGMWTEADARDKLPLTALQLQQAAAREEDGYDAAAAVTDAAAAAGIFADEDDSDGAGPAAPTEADLALVANLKRVRDDEAALLEAVPQGGQAQVGAWREAGAGVPHRPHRCRQIAHRHGALS